METRTEKVSVRVKGGEDHNQSVCHKPRKSRRG